jgi:MinD-like ATPase involved in chromosome partitioning or flagellar assembly
VRGSNRIAVVSLKGGIGKTTTTACLGLTLASYRGDRVVAVDANPDAGTLAERLTNVTDVTVRDLLGRLDRIASFTDVSAFTSLAGRLQVLASDQDPAASEAFSEEEYRAVAEVLARYFTVILTDSGTGLLHSAMSGTLALADSLVVVSAPSVDGASRASKTLDWLIAHGHEELVARSVAVISSVRPDTGDVDVDLLRRHFAARCRAVLEIPYDEHLVSGGLIDLERVGAPARRAYLELAAAVADGFALPPLTRPVAARA